MKAQSIVFLLIGLVATSAHGRLGETRAQCLLRYGIPKTEAKLTDSLYDSEAQFKTEGMSVTADFVGGKVECISFERETQKELWTNESWREYELRAILERNGGVKKWENITGDKLVELGKTLEVLHYLDELMLNRKAKLVSVWATTDQELIAVNYVNVVGPIESHKLCLRTRRSLERQLATFKTERMKKLEHF